MTVVGILGWTMLSGLAGGLAGGIAAAGPAQALDLGAGGTSSVHVTVGANRTTGVKVDAPISPASIEVAAAAPVMTPSPGMFARDAAEAARNTGASTNERTPTQADVEQGTTEDDLTTGGHQAWWWGAWLLLAVPAGSALAWWVGPNGQEDLPIGPLYS